VQDHPDAGVPVGREIQPMPGGGVDANAGVAALVLWRRVRTEAEEPVERAALPAHLGLGGEGAAFARKIAPLHQKPGVDPRAAGSDDGEGLILGGVMEPPQGPGEVDDVVPGDARGDDRLGPLGRAADPQEHRHQPVGVAFVRQRRVHGQRDHTRVESTYAADGGLCDRGRRRQRPDQQGGSKDLHSGPARCQRGSVRACA